MKRLNLKSLILSSLTIGVLICFICNSVFAQDVNDVAKSNKALDETDQLSELDIRMQKMVSIDVSDVPIEMVIKQLADQVNVDFILSPKVAGNVTVTLTDVSVEEALQSILDVMGYAFIKGKNVVRILPREEIPVISERLVTQTFEIIYADVEQVVDALQKFLSSQGKVSFVKGTSYLIVTDTEPKIREIAKLIEKIDRIIPQVLVEVRIYDITSNDNLDLGIDWYASRRTELNAGALTQDDIAINKNGTDTYISNRTSPAIISAFSGAKDNTDSTTGYLRFGILNRSINLDAQLRAEKENIDAKLLANPRILVIDNETALFDIVTQHPYVERTINGSDITETVKFKDVGTKLEVTPQVARDGKLRLHIKPEFGVVVGSVDVSSGKVPVVNTRKVDTTALVNDGQAVVLGGLRKKETTKQVNKIPLLGDIPIIGNLFKFEGETTAIGELVVFITPRIVTEPTMTEDELNAYGTTNFRGPKPSTTRAETTGLGK